MKKKSSGAAAGAKSEDPLDINNLSPPSVLKP
jgi:hypothetical protein